MAEGYLKHFAQEKANVFSAGVEVHGLNPRAVAVMQEDGVDISHHTSNLVDEYLHIPFHYLITVCNHAQEQCPVVPVRANRFHHNFADPAKATGTEPEIMQAFRQTRNEIKEYCRAFVQTHL